MNLTLSLSAICEVICADKKLFGEISYVTTDSRDIRPGCLFIALRGEKFDGHAYIGAALMQGAACAIADKLGDYPMERVLLVGSTERALRRIAALYRSALPTKIVAVTGSVGKTGTRDMAAAVLAARYNTIKTQGNLNNQIGVPQTVLGIESIHEAAVVEMGMSGMGEIEEISLCASPDIAVITNVGVTHIELLGSREAIFKAKTEITAGLAQGAPLILNGDNDFLSTYKNPRVNIILFGIENPACAVRAEDIKACGDSTELTIIYEAKRYKTKIPTMGRHNVLNALAGFTVGVTAGVTPAAAAAALAGYTPTGMRQRLVEHKGATVVEDCYNASPDSLTAALSTLHEMPCKGRRVMVYSDMLELGELACEAHRKIGAIMGELGIDILYAVGELAGLTVEEAQKSGVGEAVHFKNKQDLAEQLIKTASAGDIIWFKASRGMKLEEVLKQFYEEWKK